MPMEKKVDNKKEYMYMKVCSGKGSLENTSMTQKIVCYWKGWLSSGNGQTW